MMIDIQLLVAWITAIGIIIGVFTAAYRILDKHLLKRFSELEKKVNNIEKWTMKQQLDIANSMDEKQILIEGLLACLEGLKEQGCNGSVTENIKKIREYLFDKAHETRSQG